MSFICKKYYLIDIYYFKEQIHRVDSFLKYLLFPYKTDMPLASVVSTSLM
jgi:hypothetical protein